MGKIRIPLKYKALDDLLTGKLPNVDMAIIYGGRESSKTFTTGLSLSNAIVNYGHRALYLRYTMKSSDDSTISGFHNRIEQLGYNNKVHITKTEVSCKKGIGKVRFAGIKTSSGNQTASLKSLEGFTVLLVDECEEWTSYDEFEKIELSIRGKGNQCVSILVMNPCDESHFVYQEFFKPNNIPNEFCGIVNGILFIHSSYLDLGKEHVDPKNWKKFEAARLVYEEIEKIPIAERKERCPAKKLKLHAFYKYKVLGHWQTTKDNLCIEHWEEFKEWPDREPDYVAFGCDFGTDPDPNAVVETRVYESLDDPNIIDVYTKEHVYKNNMENSQLADAINVAMAEDVDFDGNEREEYVVCDLAQPQNIIELRKLGILAIKCKKGPGSIESGLRKIRDANLFVHEDSENTKYELTHYYYVQVINNKGEMKIEPIDKDNHIIDGLRYSLSIW